MSHRIHYISEQVCLANSLCFEIGQTVAGQNGPWTEHDVHTRDALWIGIVLLNAEGQVLDMAQTGKGEGGCCNLTFTSSRRHGAHVEAPVCCAGAGPGSLHECQLGKRSGVCA